MRNPCRKSRITLSNVQNSAKRERGPSRKIWSAGSCGEITGRFGDSGIFVVSYALGIHAARLIPICAPWCFAPLLFKKGVAAVDDDENSQLKRCRRFFWRALPNFLSGGNSDRNRRCGIVACLLRRPCHYLSQHRTRAT